MRTVLIGKASLLPVALAAVPPMVAVLALQVPVKGLLHGLMKALI